MNLFTLDIGSGTQDFLLYKSGENIRNCIKMILPSPPRIVAKKIRECTSKREDIFFTGYTMGGGANTRAVIEHIKAGSRAYAYEKPALTFSDNLDKVREMGIQILNSPEEIDAEKIELRDVDSQFFNSLLEKFGERADVLLIAAQDHGFSLYESNRRFRFKMFERILKKEGKIQSFLFHSSEVPEEFNRMKSIVESIENEVNSDIYLIDTVFAAIAGCMLDAREFPALLINFGNSHTAGAVVDEDGFIHSLFEHHTGIMESKGKDGIEEFLNQFLRGEISNEDVFNEGGHGAFIRDVVDVKDSVVTGPNMHLSERRVANFAGDVMITGNLGMIYAYLGGYSII
ncbi:MAG TPA: hypothetical protein EYP30_06580 [Archaeoglobaceae archaeon]|nr:hypothetical protein [Archaeoglobaceae archaeon]